MTELERFMTIALNTGLYMRKVGTVYGWSQPITPEHAYKESTCVTYVASVMQQAGYLPKGKYIHLTNGKLAGSGLDYIKSHPEWFEILHVKATPQRLGDGLKRGDICLYTVPHIQLYSKRNDKGSPMWYSLERGAGGIGAKAKLTLSGVFGYYTRRKIEYIIRPKFDRIEPLKVEPINISTDIKKPAETILKAIKYKLKMGMNIRASASASSKKVGYAPSGAVITQTAKSGSWVKTTYCGITGWINCSSTYAAKIQ